MNIMQHNFLLVTAISPNRFFLSVASLKTHRYDRYSPGLCYFTFDIVTNFIHSVLWPISNKKYVFWRLQSIIISKGNLRLQFSEFNLVISWRTIRIWWFVTGIFEIHVIWWRASFFLSTKLLTEPITDHKQKTNIYRNNGWQLMYSLLFCIS